MKIISMTSQKIFAQKKFNLDDGDDNEGLAEWAYQTSKQDYTESELIKEIEDLAKQDADNQ